ncbi:condensation domain-containing protein [Streptomyces griseoruber]|uniref:condensation domain-containing protein n=1 Tax=Streptomyces griseoruber TaxID=1943 RepID=UPI0006E3FCF7|nr:condensation domain-containing protein [Streptomyces griseoruber]
MDATDVHDVRFCGVRAGTAPLTWGQRWMWEEAAWFAPDHRHLNMPVVLELPDGTQLSSVLAALRTLLERHEPLRTTFPVSATGEPRQDVTEEGLIRVQERRVRPGRGRDATKDVAEQLAGELGRRPFAVDELPCRAGVVTCDGAPLRLVLVVFHVVTDDWDLRNLTAELRRLVAADGHVPEAAGDVRLQPLDQAAREGGPEGRAVGLRSLEHWRTQLVRAPADMLPFRNPAPETPRYKEVTLRSEALTLALYALSRRLRTSQTTVFLAIAAALLGRRADLPTACLTLYCNNRIDPRDEAAAGPFLQDAPMVVDLDGSLAETVRRTWQAALPAYLAGRYDPVRAHSLVEEVQRERGTVADLSCTANVMLGTDGLGADLLARAAHVTRESAEEARSRTRPGWTRTLVTDRPGRRFYLTASNAAGPVLASLRADTTLLSTAELLGFLTDIERVAVEALTDPCTHRIRRGT